MQLESWFDILPEGDVRIRGTRVSVAIVAEDYDRGFSAEETAYRYPTLSAEQVHAAILYYLTHRDEILAIRARPIESSGEEAPVVRRLRAQAEAERAASKHIAR